MYQDILTTVSNAKSDNLPTLALITDIYPIEFMKTLHFEVESEFFVLKRSEYDFCIDILNRLISKSYVNEKYL